MKTNKSIWKALTLPFNEEVHDALQQQHHAAQFIALVGRHLIPQQPDDSNTNMQYLSDKEILVGNQLSNGFRLGLHLAEFELYLLDKDYYQTAKLSITGKTRQQLLKEIKQRLTESGIDISKWGDDLHYEIPVHPVANGAVFEIRDKKYFEENALFRHNSELVLNDIGADFKDAEPVRIWPHHFDTGTLIPLDYNDNGSISKSLGLGWAIPDAMVNEAYFYLSFWSEDGNEDIKDLPELDSGEWMTPGWKGAVLRHSEILKTNEARVQHQKTESFFKSGIEILTARLK